MSSAEEFIEFADLLLAVESPTEIAIRSAVDRAYYGAYHACIDFEVSLPLIGRLSHRPGGEHENLMQRLERPDPKLHTDIANRSKILGASLRQLKQDRVHASYQLKTAITVPEATVALQQARTIVGDVRSGQAMIKALGPNAKQSAS